MSPNVPCTRITGSGCVALRQPKSLAPGGGTPGVGGSSCAPAGVALSASATKTPRTILRIPDSRVPGVCGR